MPRISPFHGLVFDRTVAGPLDQVTAPPYDVISDRHRLDYLSASPYSVVHLDLAEGSEDPGDPESRYARAAHLIADWEARGVLIRSPQTVYYAYEMAFPAAGTSGGTSGDSSPRPDRTIRGLLCAMDLEPWGGSVKPHERTMERPVQDRLLLLRATRTHMSAVYGTIAGPCEQLAALLRTVASTPAGFETRDEQGVRHRMWVVAADERIAGWLAGQALLVADGHHRYETALHYRDERRRIDGAGPWDRILTLVVDASANRLTVLPFHRIQLAGQVLGPAGREVADLAGALAACSDEDVVAAMVRPGADGSARYDTLPLAGEAPAVRALHAQLLDGRIPERSLRFVADASVADAAVRSGEAVGAYLLPPTTPGRIREVIERGDRLPPKSTYFWPKPRTGMVMMPLDLPADGSAATGPEAAPAS